MKKSRMILVLGIVASLLLASVGTVYADRPTDKPNPPGKGGLTPGISQADSASKGKPRGLFGVVSDKTGTGFKLDTQNLGEVNVVLSEDTKCKVPFNPFADCGDIMNGDWVAVKGTWDNSDFMAQRVLFVPKKGLRAMHKHVVGTVAEGSTAEVIKVDPIKGDAIQSFKVLTGTPGTKIRPEGTVYPGDFPVGTKVTVVAALDRSTGDYIAKAIVKHAGD
ncbi:MAG: hypothetical protein HY664_00665 [Chloroflexi bacterium]|nr:hypothetical protein [Chloroflexota bacterium]